MSTVESQAASVEPSSGGPILEISGLSKAYGADGEGVTAIAELDFSVSDGEFVTVVGPSGCGKTTLLKCLAGLLEPSGGEVRLRGNAITAPPPEMAIVFQDYSRSLLPWLTVRKNVMLPLRTARAKKHDLAHEALEAVGLTEFADGYAWQLSGGMQQRVAIARALAYQPKVLLMDEPFASVDAQTRAELEDLVLRVRAEFDVTVLLVTHDIDEAVYMGDRVVVLTSRPSRVKRILAVDLPRPRDQLTTKSLPSFVELRGEVYQDIRSESTSLRGNGRADRSGEGA
jgi:NitT/TauT family transport system ATP-binding protein